MRFLEISVILLPGKVVGTDFSLEKAVRTNKAYILLDPYDTENVTLLNPNVKGDVCRFGKFIVLPRTAVTLESGKHYVLKLEDGMVHKRFVQYYNSNLVPTFAWIVQGLEEGEIVITD